jgi:hypothetical protein
MNKKQLIVTSILVLLMLVLVITQGFFKNNFEQVVLMNQGISDFSKYTLDGNKYTISLPSEWMIEQKESSGQYVSYRLDFKEPNNKLTGLVEVINTKEDLNVFAEKELNNQYLEYYNSKVMPFKNSNNSGVLVRYDTSIRNGYDFKNECYYLNFGEGQTIKVLFNFKAKYYKENVEIVFNTIISSIKLS